MNSILDNGLKVVACGIAAAVITLALSLSFVKSTAVVRNDAYSPAPWTAKLSLEPGHAWFGQPQPAVLVD